MRPKVVSRHIAPDAAFPWTRGACALGCCFVDCRVLGDGREPRLARFLWIGPVGVDGLDGEGVALFVTAISHRCDADERVQGDLCVSIALRGLEVACQALGKGLEKIRYGAYLDIGQLVLGKRHKVGVQASQDGLQVSQTYPTRLIPLYDPTSA